MAAASELAQEWAICDEEIEIVAETVDESTGISWLWALLFGPLYFAVWGFWAKAALVLCLNFLLIGFAVAPFLAYAAWKARAREKAERLLLTYAPHQRF
ncbi:MAG: hypothetical protein AAF698_08285 [Pseudomonadota bacterium]